MLNPTIAGSSPVVVPWCCVLCTYTRHFFYIGSVHPAEIGERLTLGVNLRRTGVPSRGNRWLSPIRFALRKPTRGVSSDSLGLYVREWFHQLIMYHSFKVLSILGWSMIFIIWCSMVVTFTFTSACVYKLFQAWRWNCKCFKVMSNFNTCSFTNYIVLRLFNGSSWQFLHECLVKTLAT